MVSNVQPLKREEKKPPTEEEMLKILEGADRKDYERICAEHGFTDFRGILKKLKEMKKKEDVEVGKPVVTVVTTLTAAVLGVRGLLVSMSVTPC